MAWTWEDPIYLLLTLRPGVIFHDGEKFNAEAVGCKLTCDLAIKGGMRTGEVNSIQSIEVVNDLQVRLVLRGAYIPCG